MNSVVVHYQEIALKGRNRPWFIARLVRNIKTATSDLDVRQVVSKMGRIEIVLRSEAAWDPVADRLRHVFGIANFSRAGRVRLDVEVIAKAILDDLGDRQVSTFRVSARRADKRFPLTSPQIEFEVGGRIKDARGWKVNLDEPELTIHVEALTDEAFYHFGKEPGPGGMPTGVGGRVVALLSGGIDSPVASYRLMKRGCRIIPVHFHSYPILSHASQEKVRELTAALTRYQQHTRLYLVGFGEIQQKVVLTVPPPLRVVIYRRLMVRIAEAIAEIAHAQALVTGEVIGQVASQTIENLTTIGSVATLPIFRPLIGMDKDEIVAQAQKLGTYAISIIEDQDCCQLFTPKHPATKARPTDIETAERKLPIDEFVRQAVGAAVVEDFRFPRVELGAQKEPAPLFRPDRAESAKKGV
jgi:tRNA uracil 4-sulfurtransferase